MSSATYRSSLAVLLGILAAPAPAQPVPDPAGRPSQCPITTARGLRYPVVLPTPAPASPEVKAASAILIDAATGTILFEKDSRTRRPQASTTKIVTASLIIDTNRLDEQVTITDRALRTEYANLNAKAGERIPLRDLLSAILLRSSNDACVAAAEHLFGQPWRFVAMMNERARTLGAHDTQFVTTNGLYHAQHYSTAHDLALLTREACRNSLFNEIAASRRRWISRSVNQDDRLIQNHNRFLEKYQGADGVKTGYVRQSGRCLVASATSLEGGLPWKLISVVLNSSDTYGDSARMMNWGRYHYQPVYLAARGAYLGRTAVRDAEPRHVGLVAGDDLIVLTPRGDNGRVTSSIETTPSVRAPVPAAYSGGRVQALYNGKPLAEIPLVTSRAIPVDRQVDFVPWTLATALIAVIVLRTRNAGTPTKSPLRSRSGLAPRSREPDLRGEGVG